MNAVTTNGRPLGSGPCASLSTWRSRLLVLHRHLFLELFQAQLVRPNLIEKPLRCGENQLAGRVSIRRVFFDLSGFYILVLDPLRQKCFRPFGFVLRQQRCGQFRAHLGVCVRFLHVLQLVKCSGVRVHCLGNTLLNDPSSALDKRVARFFAHARKQSCATRKADFPRTNWHRSVNTRSVSVILPLSPLPQ
jgi:hypothetical protein